MARKFNSSKTVEKKDTSPTILGQREKIDFDFSIRELPWTEKQKELIDIILDKKTRCVFISGPAGTSKTATSVYSALKLLKLKKVSDIIFLRTAVESADSKLGFLPGEYEDKVQYYMVPFLNKMEEFLDLNTIKRFQKDNRVQSAAVNFTRGLHWPSKIVICDEAQNATFKELTTIITRMGEFSKILILGDPDQSDLIESKRYGFVDMCKLFDDSESYENGIRFFEFTSDDILRSDFVKFVVKKLESYKDKNK
jgi:phosphate starvation-inducible PhoH-like protein